MKKAVILVSVALLMILAVLEVDPGTDADRDLRLLLKTVKKFMAERPVADFDKAQDPDRWAKVQREFRDRRIAAVAESWADLMMILSRHGLSDAPLRNEISGRVGANSLTFHFDSEGDTARRQEIRRVLDGLFLFDRMVSRRLSNRAP